MMVFSDFWSRAAQLLRWASFLLDRWLIVLLALIFIPPVSPHVLWSFQTKEVVNGVAVESCLYLGGRGMVRRTMEGGCPVIDLLDRREG